MSGVNAPGESQGSSREKLAYFLEQSPALRRMEPGDRAGTIERMLNDFAFELSEVVREAGTGWGAQSTVALICAYNAELINPYIQKKSPREGCQD